MRATAAVGEVAVAEAALCCACDEVVAGEAAACCSAAAVFACEALVFVASPID
jgi:hypothetical protein